MSRLAVLMHTMNSEIFLAEAIRSILDQSERKFNLFILDGGSEDATIDIASAFARRDARITIIVDPKSHPAARTNKFIAEHDFDFACIAHSDDINHVERLAIQHKFMVENPDIILSGSAVDYFYHDKTGSRAPNYHGTHDFPCSHDELKANLFFWWSFATPTLILNLNSVRNHGLRFDASLEVANDWWFYWKASCIGRLANLPNSLLSYRHNPSGDGASNREKIALETKLIKKRIMSSLTLDSILNAQEIDLLLETTVEQARITRVAGPTISYIYVFEKIIQANLIHRWFDAEVLHKITENYLLQIVATWGKYEPPIKLHAAGGGALTVPISDNLLAKAQKTEPVEIKNIFIFCATFVCAATSNGILSIISLARELERLGCEVYFFCILSEYPNEELLLTKELEQRVGTAKWKELLDQTFLAASDLGIKLIVDSSDLKLADAFVVYPERIIGNPLNSGNVIRYFGNKNGMLNGGKLVDVKPRDFILTHSRILHANSNFVLFFAHVNPLFNDANAVPYENRNKNLTYVGKGDSYGEVSLLTGTEFLTRTYPATKPDLAELLKNTRFLFTWDNWTNVVSEAIFCGAIPVFLRHAPFSEKDIDESELGPIPRISIDKLVYSDLTNNFEFINIDDLYKYQDSRNAFIDRVNKYSFNYSHQVGLLLKSVIEHFSNFIDTPVYETPLKKYKLYLNKWQATSGENGLAFSEHKVSEEEPDLQKAMNELLQIALEHQNTGQVEQAKDIYLEIINSQPEHAAANHNLGVIEVISKGAKFSLARLELAVQSEPENELYWVSYIDALMQAGNFDSAADALELGVQYGLKPETAIILAEEFGKTLRQMQLQESL